MPMTPIHVGTFAGRLCEEEVLLYRVMMVGCTTALAHFARKRKGQSANNLTLQKCTYTQFDMHRAEDLLR